MKPSAKSVPRLMGVPTILVLAIPLAIGLFAAFASAVWSSITAMLVAFAMSPVELVVLPFALRSWLRAGRPRSLLGGALATGGTLAALPAAYLGLLMLNALLPVMPWERTAVAAAEEFILRNGFTLHGHPADKPVLQTDILDGIYTREKLLESRRASIQERASGIVTIGFAQRIVLFQPGATGFEGLRGYRQVEVGFDGTTHMPHQEYGFPKWMVKRVNR